MASTGIYIFEPEVLDLIPSGLQSSHQFSGSRHHAGARGDVAPGLAMPERAAGKQYHQAP